MDDVTRREALKLMAVAGATAAGCTSSARTSEEKAMTQKAAETIDPIVSVRPLPVGRPWETPDPFLFCMHHVDAYPRGNERLGPVASLAGRDIGQDFGGKDGWSMYHGDVVPGFPQHPHRGFETVTIARQGLIDHSDSFGATARYGNGDVQWLTAGRGILHAEMFPLVHADRDNPVELFQIWLNLPAASKMVDPFFTMFWANQVPRVVERDAEGRTVEVTVAAGSLGEHRPPAPPPSSWAGQADSDVAIWTIRLSPGARWTMPAANPGTNRNLYFFAGSGMRVAGRDIGSRQRIELRGDVPVALEAGQDECQLLLLQGRPIGEPVVHYGPFVMNTREQIVQTIQEYQRTQFGGWPWGRADHVHPREEGRFARHADGRLDRPA